MTKRAAPTVSVRASSRRAGNELEPLFDRLERFANLGDGLSEFEAFAQNYPRFLPVVFYDSTLGEAAREQPVGWQRDFYDLFRVFRDMLRDVWVRGSRHELGTLLGTNAPAWKIINHEMKPGVSLDGVFAGYETRLQNAVTSIPANYFTTSREINPDWGSGTFRYEADIDFRRAVYALFRQSWRAKVCPQCNKYFIADKPTRRYCSPKCYGAAKRGRDLEFWKNVGSDRRKERRTKETKQ